MLDCAREVTMGLTTAKIFRNGRNQAIRIPLEMSFDTDTDTVTIEKRGSTLIIKPLHHGTWAEYFADPTTAVPDDFELPDDLPPEPVEL